MPAEIENLAPDLPAADPAADRGDVMAATPPQEIDLTEAELELIGKGPAKEDAAKDPVKDEAAKTEDDAAKDPAKAEDKPRDKEGKFIPKARFDEVNNKARAKVAALEAANRALQERLGVVEGRTPDTKALEAQLDGKSEEYGKLIADGELDKAKVVMSEINKLNRQIGTIEATAISNSHAQESRHADSLGELVQLYKETYPQFDDANTALYNQDYVNFVARLQGGFEMGGSSPAEALREAVEMAVMKFGLDPEPEAAAAAAAPVKPDKGAERKTAAVDKALKAAAAQPTALKGGTDSDKMGMSKIDIATLDYEQFSALGDQTLKRLRGDLG